MRKAALFLLTLLLAASVVPATDVIEPGDVTPGTSGYCITELDGGELVRIPLTVIGVTDPGRPEGEMVLIRLDDPRFAEMGIVAGMSGSPVYVEGRLLGALAFAWSFALEPIAGVTPFSRMQQLAPGASQPAGATRSRPQLSAIWQGWQDGTLGDLLVDWLVPAGVDQGLVRLPVAVSVGGTQGPGEGWLARSWQRLGWVQTGAAVRGEPGAAGPIVPGSMVAAVIVEGDVSMAVGGTVTEVRDGKVWAFGHPYLSGGGLAMPLADASVLTVMPSRMASFKFFAVGDKVGSFRVDRSHGLLGELGPVTPLVPAEVVVSERTYHYRCLRHPVLLPLLAGFLTQASHAARGRSFGEQTVALEVTLRYAGDRQVRMEETLTGNDAAAQAGGMVAALVGYLENSSFAVPELEHIRVELTAEERIASSRLVDAVPERTRVRPGSSLRVRLRLRPFRGGEVSHMVNVPIPDELVSDRVDLIVAAGGSWSSYDMIMRPLPTASFDDELQLVGRLRPSTQVVVALEEPNPGVTIRGGTVAAPPSVIVALRSALGPNLGVTTHRVVELLEEELPYPIVGALRIPLKVQRDTRPRVSQLDEGDDR